MEYQSYKKRKRKEHLRYIKAKTVAWIKSHAIISKEKRKQTLAFYRYMYEDHHFFHQNNGLENDKYYIPQVIVVKELMPKDKLDGIEKGLKKLFIKNLSHKFLGGSTGEGDIEKLREWLNLALTESRSWHRFGVFDVENQKRLRNDISYFDIMIRNYSNSFVEVEFYLHLTENKKESLDTLIRENRKATDVKAFPHYVKSKRKSGALVGYAIGEELDTLEKREILYEELRRIKVGFLSYLSNFFPFVFWKNGYVTSAIFIFKTNIYYAEKVDSFWDSVGIRAEGGCFVNDSVKVFPYYNLENRHKEITDSIVIYNDETLKSKYLDLYRGNKLQLVVEILKEQLEEFYKILIISDLCEYYSEKCAYYRNQINKAESQNRHYERLLKIRYEFHKDSRVINQIKREIDLESLKKRTEKFMAKNFLIDYDRFHSYEFFCAIPIKFFKMLDKNTNELDERIEEKITLSHESREFKENKKQWRINGALAILSVATFILLIFPEWAAKINLFLTESVNEILQLCGVVR